MTAADHHQGVCRDTLFIPHHSMAARDVLLTSTRHLELVEVCIRLTLCFIEGSAHVGASALVDLLAAKLR